MILIILIDSLSNGWLATLTIINPSFQGHKTEDVDCSSITNDEFTITIRATGIGNCRKEEGKGRRGCVRRESIMCVVSMSYLI